MRKASAQCEGRTGLVTKWERPGRPTSLLTTAPAAPMPHLAAHVSLQEARWRTRRARSSTVGPPPVACLVPVTLGLRALARLWCPRLVQQVHFIGFMCRGPIKLVDPQCKSCAQRSSLHTPSSRSPPSLAHTPLSLSAPRYSTPGCPHGKPATRATLAEGNTSITGRDVHHGTAGHTSGADGRHSVWSRRDLSPSLVSRL